MPRAKSRYSSRKARGEATSDAYMQLQRALDSLNNIDNDKFRTEGYNSYRSSQVAAFDRNNSDKNYYRKDALYYANTQASKREKQLRRAAENRINAIAGATVGG